MKLTLLTACLLALLAACHNNAKSSLDVLKDSLKAHGRPDTAILIGDSYANRCDEPLPEGFKLFFNGHLKQYIISVNGQFLGHTDKIEFANGLGYSWDGRAITALTANLNDASRFTDSCGAKDSLFHYLDSLHKKTVEDSLQKDFRQIINDDTQIINRWPTVDSVSFAIVGSGGGSLTPIDTAQNVTKNPMIADGHLCEVVIIQQGGRVAYSGVERITTCEGFRQFRKDYPEFYIPAPVLATFRKCQ